MAKRKQDAIEATGGPDNTPKVKTKKARHSKTTAESLKQQYGSKGPAPVEISKDFKPKHAKPKSSKSASEHAEKRRKKQTEKREPLPEEASTERKGAGAATESPPTELVVPLAIKAVSAHEHVPVAQSAEPASQPSGAPPNRKQWILATEDEIARLKAERKQSRKEKRKSRFMIEAAQEAHGQPKALPPTGIDVKNVACFNGGSATSFSGTALKAEAARRKADRKQRKREKRMSGLVSNGRQQRSLSPLTREELDELDRTGANPLSDEPTAEDQVIDAADGDPESAALLTAGDSKAEAIHRKAERKQRKKEKRRSEARSSGGQQRSLSPLTQRELEELDRTGDDPLPYEPGLEDTPLDVASLPKAERKLSRRERRNKSVQVVKDAAVPTVQAIAVVQATDRPDVETRPNEPELAPAAHVQVQTESLQLDPPVAPTEESEKLSKRQRKRKQAKERARQLEEVVTEAQIVATQTPPIRLPTVGVEKLEAPEAQSRKLPEALVSVSSTSLPIAPTKTWKDASPKSVDSENGGVDLVGAIATPHTITQGQAAHETRTTLTSPVSQTPIVGLRPPMQNSRRESLGSADRRQSVLLKKANAVPTFDYGKDMSETWQKISAFYGNDSESSSESSDEEEEEEEEKVESVHAPAQGERQPGPGRFSSRMGEPRDTAMDGVDASEEPMTGTEIESIASSESAPDIEVTNAVAQGAMHKEIDHQTPDVDVAEASEDKGNEEDVDAAQMLTGEPLAGGWPPGPFTDALQISNEATTQQQSTLRSEAKGSLFGLDRSQEQSGIWWPNAADEDRELYDSLNDVSKGVFEATRSLPTSKPQLPCEAPTKQRQRNEQQKLIQLPHSTSLDPLCLETGRYSFSGSVVRRSLPAVVIPSPTVMMLNHIEYGGLSLFAQDGSESPLSELGQTPSPPQVSRNASPVPALDIPETVIQAVTAKAQPKKKRKMIGATSKRSESEMKKRSPAEHSLDRQRDLPTDGTTSLPMLSTMSLEAVAETMLGNPQQENYTVLKGRGKRRRPGPGELADLESPNASEYGVSDAEPSAKCNTKRSTAKRTAKRSQYFPPTKTANGEAGRASPLASKRKTRVAAGTSTSIVPPISSERFGLIQEKLWSEPFWLLIAVTFLNKTGGKAAAPIFWQLKSDYPNPAALADASQKDLLDRVRRLGLQTQRSNRLIAMSKAWLDARPAMGIRFRTLHYPSPGDGKRLGKHVAIEGDSEECAGAIEIGRIPGCGPYAWDSWRIFCRDVLRGLAEDYNGKGAGPGFEPEWKRVLPMDKELRACLRWMWLREGFVWDPFTGKRRDATAEELDNAMQGHMPQMDFADDGEETSATSVDAATEEGKGVGDVAPLGRACADDATPDSNEHQGVASLGAGHDDHGGLDSDIVVMPRETRPKIL